MKPKRISLRLAAHHCVECNVFVAFYDVDALARGACYDSCSDCDAAMLAEHRAQLADARRRDKLYG